MENSKEQGIRKEFLLRVLPPLLVSILILYSAWAALARWGRIEAEKEPLNSDVPVFVDIAKNMHYFYDSSFIEPLYIFTLKLFLRGVPPVAEFLHLPRGEEAAVRLHSLFYELLLLFLIYHLGKKIFPTSVALVAAVLTGLNSLLVYYSVSGMREPLYSLMAFLFTYALFYSKESRYRFLKIGIAAAAVTLVRLSSLAVIFLLFVYFTARSAILKKPVGRVVKELTMAGVILVILVLPFLIQCRIRFGEAFYNAKQYTIFWANIEYRGIKTFPTLEEIQKNPSAGKLLSPYEYIVGMHGAGGAAVRYVHNYVLAYSHYLAYSLRSAPWLLYVGLLGMLVMIALKHDGPVASLFAFLLPTAFILNLNPVQDTMGMQGVEMRFVLYIFPFFALAMAFGILAIVKALDQREVFAELAIPGDGAGRDSRT